MTMTARRGVFKNDADAVDAWGAAYADIPKSVFALIAWHLANGCSESADTPGMAERRFVEEWDALLANGFDLSRPTKALRRELLAKAERGAP